MSIIETEIWKPNPERPGTIIFDSQRVAQDVFTELEAHLKADGRLPDEYFLFDSHGNWRNGALFPKDGEILCNVNYGGSEGIYLDIVVRYEKDVYEHSRDNGVLGWHKRTVTEGFATGKTLGDSISDLDKMNLVASSVMAAFYGSKAQIRERYSNIMSGNEQRIYPLPPGEQKAIEAAVRDNATNTVQAINGEVKVGDWVIAEPSDEYGCLVGVVTAIDRLGTPEHDTENPGDDIHVDFMAIEYSDKAKAEIFEAFDHTDMDADSFDELPLDDVIMAPDMLIRITELGHDEIDRLANDYNSAEAYCKTVMSDLETPSETPPVKSVSRKAIQAYNMEAAEFEKLMYGLLPDASITALTNLKGYANELEAYGTHTKAEYFLEMFIEFDLVKQHYGEEIALKLFNHAEHFTMNPFEVRGAANHLRDGRDVSEIEALSVEGVCDRLDDEWNQSHLAIQAFLSERPSVVVPLTEQQRAMINELSERADKVQLTHPKSTDTQSEVSTPPEPPAAPQKRSLGDKLQAAGEKVKAQNAQDNKKTSRKRDERS